MNFAFYVSGNAGTLKKVLKNNSPVLKDTKVVIIDSKPSKDLLEYLETLSIKCIFRKYDLSFSDFMLNILLNDGFVSNLLKSLIIFLINLRDKTPGRPYSFILEKKQ